MSRGTDKGHDGNYGSNATHGLEDGVLDVQESHYGNCKCFEAFGVK